MSDGLTIHRKEGVLSLVLSRPERLNALDSALYHALAEALEAGDRDADIRAIRLTGEGGSFCAGNDLRDFLDYDGSPEGLAGPRRLLLTLAGLETPLLAGVQGHAVGIGTTLLLHCDQVICSEEAKLRLPFTRLGVVPEGGSSKLLVEWLGHPRAFDLLVMGESCDAATARQLGLVNRVVERAALEEALDERIETLMSLDPEAVRQAKRLLKGHGRREALQQAIAEELEHFGRLLAGERAQGAIRALLG